MKRLFVSVAALLAVGLVVLLITQVGAKRADSDPRNLETVRVMRRNISSVVKAIGVVKPMVGAEVRVGSSASGIVSRLLVRVGDRVEKGALLAELDSRELLARRAAAEAEVQLQNTNVQYTLSDLKRKQELKNAQVIAHSELELAERAHAVAEQQYQQAKANLADIVTQLEYTRIIAPVSGTVESVSTQEGETVASSFATPTFVTLLDLSRLEVWAYVDETDIGRIRVGQKAAFTVDTYADYEFNGRVTTVYPQAQIRDNVVDYITVIRFQPSTNHVLRPEMTTAVKIALDQRENVLSLPIQAVHHDGKRQFVLVRNGNRLERKWITTGTRDDTYVEVRGGLQDDNEVIITETHER